jgi:hypothetical protein
MGGIIGGVIGAAGSYLGGQSAKSNDLTGYNYLSGQRPQLGAGAMGYAKRGDAANLAASELLGVTPITDQTKNGFANYLNSTGYNFQREQGTAAITGSAAARGVLNSGATAKALTKYGNDLASTSFNNYLTQLSAQGSQGLTATGQIGTAGTEGGQAAGAAMAKGIGGAAGSIAGIVDPLKNYFGSV